MAPASTGTPLQMVWLEVLSQEWSYYVNDHLGNTRAVLSETGTAKAVYDYHPFGADKTVRLFLVMVSLNNIEFWDDL